MIKKKRYSLTLLEVILALSLTGILLTTLWQVYHNWIRSSQLLQKTQIKTNKIFFTKQRLDKLFFLLLKKPDTPLLFTPSSRDLPQPSLCFGYEADPDKEESFNGFLHSLLYVDDKKNLCLATWSRDQQCRVDVIQDLISSLSFSFFNPETNLWQPDWPKSSPSLPIWVEILLNTPEGPERLLFKTLVPKTPILYTDSKEY